MDNLTELQKEDYNIMQRIDAFCHKKEIKYMLFAGTLLGAVRHKGFIPWDDDMDILMKREDFTKFDDLLVSGNFDGEEYHYQSNRNYKYYPSEATKVRTSKVDISEKVNRIQKGYNGAWVDVFPYDNIPDDEDLRVRQFNTVHKYNRILYMTLLIRETDRDNGIKKILKKGIRLINELFHPLYFFVPIIINKRHAEITKYNETTTTEMGNFGYMFYKDYKEFSGNNIATKDFDDLVRMPFHETKFFGPSNYDEILTHKFGDYMKVPDEEDRETHDIVY